MLIEDRAKRLRWTALRPYRQVRTTAALRAGLPPVLAAPVRYLATGRTRDPAADALSVLVESLRGEIAAGTTPVPIYYSPKPAAAGGTVQTRPRPEPGEVKSFTMRQVAYQASIPVRWGVFLSLCVDAAGAGTVVELGSCAGIASAYLAGARSRPAVLTVEASPRLAAMARRTAGRVSDRVTVVNALFDDALDTALPALTGSGVDLAWIDGHHERVATLHYLHRLVPALSPGALVLFDDISWSADMRSCWEDICRHGGFSDVVDLGKCGVGIWQGGHSLPRRWDLRCLAETRRIGQPQGWR